MKINCILFLVLFFFFAIDAIAQDSLQRKKNSIFIEVAGNNFADPNSSADAGFISINYCRKVIVQKNAFLISFGIGPLKAQNFDPQKMTAVPITIINLPIGILWRYNYKRNGFWIGAYFTSAIGKIEYSSDRGMYAFSYTDKSSFQISPNLSYLFQSKNEHFFCKLSLTPKILASNFSSKYGDQQRFYPLWGGICIGGAW